MKRKHGFPWKQFAFDFAIYFGATVIAVAVFLSLIFIQETFR